MFQRIRHRLGSSLLGRHQRLVGVTGLALLVGSLWALSFVVPQSSPAAPSAISYSGEWTLLELERHIQAGDVVAVAVQAPAQGAPADLVARTLDRRVMRILTGTSAGDAASALASLGYAALLSDEAWQAAAASGRPSGSPAELVRSLGSLLLMAVLVGAMIFLLVRVNRGRREGNTRFSTIRPAEAKVGRPGTTAAGSAGPATLPQAVRLADVAGCDEAKLELTEPIDFLRAPGRFTDLGARIPRGILLYGPPGTGKTMLAKAVATEAGVAFISASGSEFVEKYVGVGARRVRDLFVQARNLGRAVIFIDEFDALGKARGGLNSHEEREQTLNQLLVEMDGFSSSEEIVVIAATNRVDVLDPAVVRPGRFTRKVHVGLPDVAGRREILAIHARNKPLAPDADLDVLARKTYGFSGAQLADLLNEAAILAARRAAEAISMEDLHGGWLKVAVGTGRRRSMDERERSIIAAHEVGHAICGRLHGDKRKVEEISLFAHGEALGVTVSSQEDNDLPSESDLRARLIALMGGRAAEELLFQEVTGGASNDFDKANQIAHLMVTRWGMGRDPEAADGGISGRGALGFLVPSGGATLPSEVQAAATRAIRAILDEAYEAACQTLVTEMPMLRRIAAYLFQHERMDGETFDALFNGQLEVPSALDEWRAATARPREWEDIAGYADRRRRRPAPVAEPPAEPAPLPVAAAAATPLLATEALVVPITAPGVGRRTSAQRPTLWRGVRGAALLALRWADGHLGKTAETPGR
ncbi:MAG TPA: AAA family ATPase [Candidatus Limnocylindrales bacterium]|nr:AAA family ATPase [Candidatus Limnocylindrales bacterium]